jgi:hypothetical protein
MKRDLASALEDCIAQLRAGRPLEECLRRYPEHADEIRSLIGSSIEISRVEIHPDYQAMARGRRHYFQLAAQKKGQASRTMLGFPLRYTRHVAAAMAGAAMTATIGMSALVYQSFQAEPGDGLYSVRLFVEDARLRLPFYDDNDRSGILLDYVGQRYSEIREMLSEEGPVHPTVLSALQTNVSDLIETLPEDGKSPRPAEVSQAAALGENLLIHSTSSIATSDRSKYLAALSAIHAARLYETDPAAARAFLDSAPDYEGITRVLGSISDLPGDLIAVGGVPMRVDASTLLQAELDAPSAVATAGWHEDGTLHALTVSGNSGDRAEEVFLQGQVESYLQGVLTITGQRVLIEPDSVVVGPIRLGSIIEVTANRNDEGILEAEVAVVRADELQAESFVYEGYLQAVGDPTNASVWQVGGQYFRTSSLTLIDSSLTPLSIGAYARVEAANVQGQLAARRLHVISSPADPNAQAYVRLRGTVDEVGENNIAVINGIRVRIDPQLRLAQGVLAELEGTWDGEYLNAFPDRTRFLDESIDGRFVVEGILTAVENDGVNPPTYHIGSFSFGLTTDTLVTGTIALGARVSVRAVLDENGGVRALRVDVLRNAPVPDQDPLRGQEVPPPEGQPSAEEPPAGALRPISPSLALAA